MKKYRLLILLSFVSVFGCKQEHPSAYYELNKGISFTIDSLSIKIDGYGTGVSGYPHIWSYAWITVKNNTRYRALISNNVENPDLKYSKSMFIITRNRDTLFLVDRFEMPIYRVKEFSTERLVMKVALDPIATHDPSGNIISNFEKTYYKDILKAGFRFCYVSDTLKFLKHKELIKDYNPSVINGRSIVCLGSFDSTIKTPTLVDQPLILHFSR